MSMDPAIYINMGHTCMQDDCGGNQLKAEYERRKQDIQNTRVGEEDKERMFAQAKEEIDKKMEDVQKAKRIGIKKAIAFYEKAKKLKPDDVHTRLFIAQAYFSAEEYDHAIAVLSDAIQIWPHNLLLRYNLAIWREEYGAHLVSKEQKTKRLVGASNAVEIMMHAIDLMLSATRLFVYVEGRWNEMTEEQQREVADDAAAPAGFQEQMKLLNLHKSYCRDISEQAREELKELVKKQTSFEEDILKVDKRKKEETQTRERVAKRTEAEDEEDAAEREMSALRLMESGLDIKLPRHIAELAKFKEKLGKRSDRHGAQKPAVPEKRIPDSMVDAEEDGGERKLIMQPTDGQEEYTAEEWSKYYSKREKKKKKKKGKKEKKNLFAGYGADAFLSDAEGDGGGEGREALPPFEDGQEAWPGEKKKKDKKHKKDKKEKKRRGGGEDRKRKFADYIAEEGGSQDGASPKVVKTDAGDMSD